MSDDTLGDRMKKYEDVFRIKLLKRSPKVIRLDGKAFHTFLRNAEKPFDKNVISAMEGAAWKTIKEIGGVARFAYIQSDECSIAINDALTLNTEAWFDNNLQKMVSVAASIFTETFNRLYKNESNIPAYFDARAFVLPDLDELLNYFVWRQNDATRNSIRMYAHTMFSTKELEGVSNKDAQEMMFAKTGFNWNDAMTWTKRGVVTTGRGGNYDIPIFTADRSYLTNLFLPATIENEQ
jgi:tRNA(His) 5'-end guanylyltransferase